MYSEGFPKLGIMNCSVNKRVPGLNIFEKQYMLYPPLKLDNLYYRIKGSEKIGCKEIIFLCLVPNFPKSFDVGIFFMGFTGGSDSKEFACNVGDLDLISGSGRFPGVGSGNPLQYSCLENFMDIMCGAYKELIS